MNVKHIYTKKSALPRSLQLDLRDRALHIAFTTAMLAKDIKTTKYLVCLQEKNTFQVLFLSTGNHSINKIVTFTNQNH